nr:MAG TPA: hypothetical protein [Caudoviricetes sp.]
MTNLKEKLEQEKKELDGKIGRLKDFIENKEIFYKIPVAHQELLIEQERAMAKYSIILEKRISLLESE